MSRISTRHDRDLRRRRTVRIVTIALLVAAALIAGFYLGQHAVYSGLGMDLERYRQMELALPLAQDELAARNAELEVEQVRNSVDRQALELVRGEIADYKDQISALEEGIRFYRSLMSPGEINQGLSLRPIELIAREQVGHFAFRIVAQQQARKHQLLKGRLGVEVFGTRDGEPVSYPLSALSSDLDEDEQALRFRYFQAIEGELQLPPGFEPGGVVVVATVTSPRKTEVRADFPWQVKERFAHVGK